MSAPEAIVPLTKLQAEFLEDLNVSGSESYLAALQAGVRVEQHPNSKNIRLIIPEGPARGHLATAIGIRADLADEGSYSIGERRSILGLAAKVAKVPGAEKALPLAPADFLPAQPTVSQEAEEAEWERTHAADLNPAPFFDCLADQNAYEERQDAKAADAAPILKGTDMTIHPNIARLYAQPEGTVLAVQVRKVDPPQFVAEDIEDLLERSSRFWAGEQCDSCGCCAYVIENVPTQAGAELREAGLPLGWQVRCCGDADEAKRWADEGAEPEAVEAIRTGCGAVYDLRYEPEGRVAF